MITSARNPKLLHAKSLLSRRGRQREGRWLLEGRRLIQSAIESRANLRYLLFDGGRFDADDIRALLEVGSESGPGSGSKSSPIPKPKPKPNSGPASESDPSLGIASNASAGLSEPPAFEVEPKLLAQIAETETSQGLLAVVDIPNAEAPTAPSLVMVLDAIRDPGNLGSLLRTAAAAGLDALILSPGCVDPGNPKVLRSAMGAHFQVPILRLSYEGIAEYLQAHEFRPWMADAAAKASHSEVDWTQASALIIGGEAHGISDEMREIGGNLFAIPMPGPMESLNASTAAAIIVFEALRQRGS